MVTFVSAEWVAERINAPEFLLLDPRRPMKYLQGHLQNAVNLPLFQAFDITGALLPPDRLAAWLGAAGLDAQRTPVVYDSPHGQNAAMLAWVLEYLGRPDSHLLKVFFEQWKAQGYEVFYKPVSATAKTFTPYLNPVVRAALDDVRANPAAKLIDFRSPEEYDGVQDLDGSPGHIPRAVNIVWRDVGDAPYAVLTAKEKIEQLVTTAGISRSDQIIAYCRTGPRAAVGYLALKQCGYHVRLYDGSYAEWARSGLPVERTDIQTASQKSRTKGDRQ